MKKRHWKPVIDFSGHDVACDMKGVLEKNIVGFKKILSRERKVKHNGL